MGAVYNNNKIWHVLRYFVGTINNSNNIKQSNDACLVYS